MIQADRKLWPFKVLDVAGQPKVLVEYRGEIKTFFAEEISSMVLTKDEESSRSLSGNDCH